jgi:heat shock 70kDa protein 1/2/6/8
MANEYIIGIDLGTTNSLVSIWRNNNYEIISDLSGNTSIPSIVSFTKTSKYTGQDAKNMLELDPINTIYEVKRLIGRKYSDETVVNDKYFLSYDITQVESDRIGITIFDKILSPEEISSTILTELKNMASSYLKTKITKTVITVPAYFNDAQRQATKDAATIAGLDCLRIINEPTAAALAYGLQEQSLGKDLNVIIYDLGGGTLDVSLLNISDGIFQVLASTGNTHLGGTDFDNRLIGYCLKEFKLKNNLEEFDSVISLQKLRKAVENAKKILSTLNRAVINIPNFYNNVDLNIILTRADFENICQDLFILALKPLEDVLHSASLTVNDIQDIILVGGATRMDAIRRNIKLYFKGKEPNSTINPDTVVTIGAAIQGYILLNKDSPFSKNITLLDIIPLSLGIENLENIMNVIIPRNSIIPIKKEKKFTTDTDFMESVDIKIYEGERKLTTNNNLLGQFTLTNIFPDYRGGPQINVIFSVDINGIISVTAEDLKNKNTSGIVVKNSKNLLSTEEINKLVDEATQMEVKDSLERKRKELRYRIYDLITNIKFNLESQEYKIVEKDTIIENINKIKYDDLEIQELKTLKKNIKKEYGILIFKRDCRKLKDISEFSKLGESLYNDNKEETLEDCIININYDDAADIENMRNSIIELCGSVLEIIEQRESNDMAINLKDKIDDTIMWLYIKENITLIDYSTKMEELTNMYSEYNENYQQTLNFSNNFDSKNNLYVKKNSLEQLCYNVLSVLLSNNYSVHDNKIMEIKALIDKILEFLVEIGANIHITQKEGAISDDKLKEYNQLLVEYEMSLNKECDELYNMIIK